MTKIAIIIVFFGLLASVTPFVSNKTQKKVHPDRIVGQDAKKGELPYQISLCYNGQHICGGALVKLKKQQVIITAAHCVNSGRLSNYTVIAGELDNLNNSNVEQTRQVTRIFAHENFNGWTYANDIAVLFMATPFNLDANVQPIALPESRQQTTGQIVLSGWGKTGSDGSIPRNLQYVQIPVVDDNTCQRAYDEEIILESMLCTGVHGEDANGKDSCQGESGGPVRSVEGNYLAAITSWGYGCDDAKYPNVNTEVSYFIDWLNAQV